MLVSEYERLQGAENIPFTFPPNDILANEVDLKSNVRPATYYGDGAFDPPSSDDEDELLLEKNGPSSPGIAERGLSMGGEDEGVLVVGGSRKRPASLRFLLVSLVTLVTLAGIIGIIAAHSYTGTPYHVPGARRITMDHIFNGTFGPESKGVNWVPEAGDGVFSTQEDLYIKLVDLKTGKKTNLVSQLDIKDDHNRPISWSTWALSADMTHLLVKADHMKQWRYSSFGNYYIHNLAEGTTRPLVPPSHPPRTAHAQWSPTGDAIAYVLDNDLYVLPSPAASTPLLLAHSSSPTVLHGVPSWVYEEEILSSPSAFYWSPGSTRLAWLSFDETNVKQYEFPIYNESNDNNKVVPYTKSVKVRYPKPGFANPAVTVSVYEFNADLDVVGGNVSSRTVELDWAGRGPVNDRVTVEVTWVGDDELVVKEVNRNADSGVVVLFGLDNASVVVDKANGIRRSLGTVVRALGREGEEGDDGWIDNDQTIYPLPPASNISGYLDIVPSPDGYNHIALFSPASTRTPRFLTAGEWEVTGGILGIDAVRGLVYFQAANPSSIERDIFSVPLPSLDLLVSSSPLDITPPTSLTLGATLDSPVPAALGPRLPAFYGARFSPEAGFYLLSYMGPGIPWQKVVKVGDTDFNYVLTDNALLRNVTQEYEAPVVTHSTIMSEGYELNVKEIRPPRMDDSGRTKYPVLFRVYGGPHSQLVDVRFARDWHDYVACGLQYIVVIVDGRGTGFKGRQLRNPVKGNLGFWETRDQVNAARIWADKEYVDPRRIGIWGWSYGGFMSSKVIEADAGIHTLAMAVAPVTSWLLYDSIYTERYMNLPSLNRGGYVNASISNVTAFRSVDYLLAHGSGDDNVHFSNSAHLLDMFTKAQVRNFRFRMFTDSDHSISRRGAQREVYEFLTGYIVEKWGRGGRRRGW